MPSNPIIMAFDRLDDFVAVQQAAGGITLEAVGLLQRSVGIDEAGRAIIGRRVEAIANAEAPSVIFGMVVGLMAAQLERA